MNRKCDDYNIPIFAGKRTRSSLRERTKDMDTLKSTRNTKKKKPKNATKLTQSPKQCSFPCTLCAYTGATRKYLRRHVKVSHGDRRFKCDECGKMFHFGCKLRDHMRVHTGEKPNKCDVCGKAFNSTYSLSTHKLIHTDSKPFQCAFCEYACRDSSTLRKHHARHTGTEKYYQCKMCDVSLKSKSKLKLHIAEKHLNVDVRTHICDACGKRFKIKSNLAKHIRSVHERARTVSCGVCGAVLSERSNLPAHMRTHVAQKPYVCTVDMCRRRFKHTSSLSKHVITHYPAEWFACGVCDKRFPRRRRLESHLRTHQAKVKRVQCDYCGVRFYNKNYLTRHIQRKHSRKRQKYICDMCDFVTTNKPSIVMHIKYGHAVNNFIQCKMCEKRFKRDFNLKLHYWTAHGIKYKITIKKKPKKPLIIVKTEPQEYMEENEFMQVTPKIEPLDGMLKPIWDDAERKLYEGMLLEDNATDARENQLRDISQDVFEDLISPGKKRPDDGKATERTFIDKQTEVQVKKQVTILLEKTRQKIAALALERARRKYNRLMRNAIKKSRLKAQKQIKYYNNNRNSASLLVEDYSISHNTVKEKEILKDKENEVDNGNAAVEEYLEEEYLDEEILDNAEDTNNKSVEDTEQNTVEANDKSKAEQSGCNRKLRINTHQCYVCFKLYDTKEKLLDHCKDHFDLCHTKTLKKCPLCEYATNLSVTRHLQRAHNIKIKIPYANIKDNGNKEGSRYYYDVGDAIVDKVEIIPSIRNLNRQAYRKIDERNRAAKNNGLVRSKLVKKGEEWVVVKEKLKVDDYMLPKFDMVGSLDVKGGYVERMKALSRIAKKNGAKMLFPCDRCDKICQTLSALKLHGRKHEANPKPFRPKVWKHKTTNSGNQNRPEARTDQSKATQVGNIAKGYVKRDRRKRQHGVTKEEYRLAPPKPVDSKHRCERELIEFYESNIKGGDIEFWQFLKIYNKLGRENVNDFSGLEATFGAGKEPEKTADRIRTMVSRRDAFKRVRLSKREMLRRNKMREELREKIRHNNG